MVSYAALVTCRVSGSGSGYQKFTEHAPWWWLANNAQWFYLPFCLLGVFTVEVTSTPACCRPLLLCLLPERLSHHQWKARPYASISSRQQAADQMSSRDYTSPSGSGDRVAEVAVARVSSPQSPCRSSALASCPRGVEASGRQAWSPLACS
jgi:hypothetical protein